MKKTRRLGIIGTALVMLAGLGIYTAPSAFAATCSSGYVCLWTSTYETGTKMTISLGDGVCHHFTGIWIENVSSAWNRTGKEYYLHTDYNCHVTGIIQFLDPGWTYDVMTQIDNKSLALQG